MTNGSPKAKRNFLKYQIQFLAREITARPDVVQEEYVKEMFNALLDAGVPVDVLRAALEDAVQEVNG